MAHLPPESALSTASRLERNALSDADRAKLERDEPEHDFEAEMWSREMHLLAAIRDELNFIRYSYDQAHSKSKPKWQPEQLPRPGIKPKKKERRPLNDRQVDTLWAHLQSQLEEGA